MCAGSFGDVVERRHAAGELVTQPRMGFADTAQMRAGLLATKHANAATVGTITLDSYTRVGDHKAVRDALARGGQLNGYPITGHGSAATRALLQGVQGPDFPVQVRHGSADPRHIIAAMLASGLHATEGGPVSYCLPYSRMPLTLAVDHWARSCELLATARAAASDAAVKPHLETFGGCMMGQLCPPALLVALSVLEGLFFWQHGIASMSFSYAQQTNPEQDLEAVRALRRLVRERLPHAQSHVVVYTYMGVFPRTRHGAQELLAASARLAVRSGAARLIVKTTAEAHRIPTIKENVLALEHGAAEARRERDHSTFHASSDTGVYEQARSMVDAVLECHTDVGRALVMAFARGYIDVPYCLHPDNAGRTRGYIDPSGRLLWRQIGSLPIRGCVDAASQRLMTSGELLTALSYMERKYDGGELARTRRPGLT
jgi:methylaspartate mutase epsilon subunit